MEVEQDFEYYRDAYIVALLNGTFPWESAYFYYTEHIDRIDIMSFREFQEDISDKSEVASIAGKDPITEISLPIYDALEKYYEPNYIEKDNKIVKIY